MDEIDYATFWREVVKDCRAEMDFLRRQIERLEESRERWRALAEAYRILSEDKN